MIDPHILRIARIENIQHRTLAGDGDIKAAVRKGYGIAVFVICRIPHGKAAEDLRRNTVDRTDLPDALGIGSAVGIVDIVVVRVLCQRITLGVEILQHMMHHIKGVCFVTGIIEGHHIAVRTDKVAVFVILKSDDQPLIKGVGNIVGDDRKTLGNNGKRGGFCHRTAAGSSRDKLSRILIPILHAVIDIRRMNIGKGEHIIVRIFLVLLVFDRDRMAGEGREIAAVIFGKKLIEGIARLGIKGTGVTLIGIACGVPRYRLVVSAVCGKINIGALYCAVCHRIGLIVPRVTACLRIQQRQPIV